MASATDGWLGETRLQLRNGFPLRLLFLPAAQVAGIVPFSVLALPHGRFAPKEAKHAMLSPMNTHPAQGAPGLAEAEMPVARRFLVIADGTPESRIALRFACRQAMDSRGILVLMTVIETQEFQHWLGVESIMKEEARDAADAMLRELAVEARAISGAQPELVLREGGRKEQLLAYLKECRDSGNAVILVLGAATGAEGPGPLVSALVGSSEGERLSIPVIVVPGNLSAEQIRLFC